MINYRLWRHIQSKPHETRNMIPFVVLLSFPRQTKIPYFCHRISNASASPFSQQSVFSSNYELRWSRDHEVLYKCLTQRERERNSFTGLRIISVHVSQVGNPWSKIPFLRFEDKLKEIGNVQGTWNESTCMCHYLKIFREH